MVRVSMLLCRVPVIKFRSKGGSSRPGGAPAPAASNVGSCPVAAAPAPAAAAAAAPAAVQAQPAAAMSTGAIPDIDLPARYKRQPLTDEEIDHINGGGIV